MIVDLERRVVLLTPPKCATVFLHDVLGRQGALAVLGPQFDGGVGEHTVMLPGDVWSAVGEFTFAVVTRDPYDRARSLYGHYRRYWDPPHLDFAGFLTEIVVAPRHLFFNATITSMLAPLEEPVDGHPPVVVHRRVRLEHLVADLGALGLHVDEQEPRQHRSTVPPPDHTARTLELVGLWARHDLDRFGYERRDPARSSGATSS